MSMRPICPFTGIGGSSWRSCTSGSHVFRAGPYRSRHDIQPEISALSWFRYWCFDVREEVKGCERGQRGGIQLDYLRHGTKHVPMLGMKNYNCTSPHSFPPYHANNNTYRKHDRTQCCHWRKYRLPHNIHRPSPPCQPHMHALPPILLPRLGNRHRRRHLHSQRQPRLSRPLGCTKRAHETSRHLRHGLCYERVPKKTKGRWVERSVRYPVHLHIGWVEVGGILAKARGRSTNPQRAHPFSCPHTRIAEQEHVYIHIPNGQSSSL